VDYRSFHAVSRARDEINQVGCHTAQEADYEQYPTKPEHLPCPPLRGFLYEAKSAAIRIKLYLARESGRVVRKPRGDCSAGGVAAFIICSDPEWEVPKPFDPIVQTIALRN
jgi:hypothetical protein